MRAVGGRCPRVAPGPCKTRPSRGLNRLRSCEHSRPTERTGRPPSMGPVHSCLSHRAGAELASQIHDASEVHCGVRFDEDIGRPKSPEHSILSAIRQRREQERV
jgi:hypothetical protein